MRTIRLGEDTYHAAVAAAEQRGLTVEQLVEEVLRGVPSLEHEPDERPTRRHRPYREMVGSGRACRGRFPSLDAATAFIRAERDTWVG
jgi:hypothetical protein